MYLFYEYIWAHYTWILFTAKISGAYVNRWHYIGIMLVNQKSISAVAEILNQLFSVIFWACCFN